MEKGSILSFCRVLFREDDCSVIDKATEFRPERHEEIDGMKLFAPFGYAPRVCIGQRLAIVELSLLLIHLLQNFTWSVKEDHVVEEVWDVTLGPKRTGMYIAFKSL